MSFDVKAKVEELVGKVQKDPATLKDFQDDPIKTVEKLLGVDLPVEQLQQMVAGIRLLPCSGIPCPQVPAIHQLPLRPHIIALRPQLRLEDHLVHAVRQSDAVHT